MRILFLCHRFPYPPEGGGKVRAYHMVRHLAQRGHEIALCSLTRSDAERQGVAKMREYCRHVDTADVAPLAQASRMLARLPTREPSSFGYFWSPELARKVRARLQAQTFDLILVHCSSMGPYVRHVEGTPKLMDFADMDSQKWLDYSRHKGFPTALGYALEGRKLQAKEIELARSFDVCTTISLNEMETLDGFGIGKPSHWFPNGVDLEYFAPTDGAYDRDLICFVGRMDYFPNEQAMLWFCNAVWPKLKERRARLKLRIVGAEPPRSVRRLAELDGVEVTGFVPDVRPHVRPAALTVAPLQIARGLQNKALESMAMGVPVVATERVRRGLGSENSPLQLAADENDYVETILEILDSPTRRAQLAAASRAFVLKEFSWPSAMAKLDSIIERCVEARHATRTGFAPAGARI